MKKFVLAATAALVLAGSSAVYAHSERWFGHHRFSSGDRAAIVDARIASVRAGLKLTPNQDRLWPPLEAAVRDFAKSRVDRAQARHEARQNGDAVRRDPVERLHARADAMAADAAALKRIAEAADPLYRTLDDGQKRRLSALMGHGRGFEGTRHHFRHRDEDGRDRGRHDWRNSYEGPAPERL